MTTANYPKKIDRFIINQILGKGAQGVVYLATDPDLDRKVAIKALRLHSDLQRQQNTDQLLAEARTVSRLQHNNIVTIYDLGVVDHNPFLVLEYIEGQSLQKMLQTKLSFDKVIRIMRDVLSGVAAAHEQNIVHCDIKPANILIDADGHAKVADFGLAQLADAKQANEEALYGTPQYMAPEYIETRQHKTVSDVFSIGLVFYEMLTGKTAVQGNDVYQILNAITHSNIAAPSKVNSAIDDGLDALILKSLEKDPQHRYANAGEMLKAFSNYLSINDESKHSDLSGTTANFLLRRMRHKKDFPAFSQTISILNRASSSDTESLSTVSNAILRDYSLTNKMLRLVNSAYYNRGGGKISTISRAVVMMGINPVRNIASALMLFEHLQNKLQAHQLKEDAVQSLFSALMANDLAGSQGIRNHEEAFVCSLLQQLGKMLVRFYLHEESRAIDKFIAQHDCSESSAVSQVLGTSYHQLGMLVAREWGFPEQIINSMKPLNFDNLADADTEAKKLQMISQFSNALCSILKLPLDKQSSQLKILTKQFSSVLKIDQDKVLALIQKCQKELVLFTKLINFDISKSIFYQQIPANDEQMLSAGEETVANEFDSASGVEILEEDTEEQNKTTEKVLTDGIQDITNSLTGDFTINQIMQMILETIYRALPGSRVVLCLKDKNTNAIRARLGYGEDVDEIVTNFSIPLAYQADVFHVAFKKNVDIRIDDTGDAKIRQKIPEWYRQNINSKSFAIFPIIIKHSPIALIYIDSPSNETISITDNQLGLLKTLRNQAILALKTVG